MSNNNYQFDNAEIAQTGQKDDGQHGLLPIEPKLNINIRLASMRDDVDIKAIDALHKNNVDGLGYWPLGRIEGAIKQGRVLIAETIPACCPDGKAVEGIRGSLLGFLIYTNKYCKHEDVSCIYAVCVQSIRQRGLIGAALVKNAFERMPYSIKLACCWCARDLDANYFWQSLGFSPIAYRTGSAQKERIHIFWQKRIREDDVTSRWWYPSLTSGGAMNEGRLVLPMLPGMDWRDPKPMVLPQVPGVDMFKTLPGETMADAAAREEAQAEKDAWKEEAKKLRELLKLSPEQEADANAGRPWRLTAEQEAAQEEYNKLEARRRKSGSAKKKKKVATGKREYSEQYLEGARVICSIYLDQLEAAGVNALPGGGIEQKYDCSRSLESALQASGMSTDMFRSLQAQVSQGLTLGSDEHDTSAHALLPSAGVEDDDESDIIDAAFTLHDDADDGEDWDKELRDAA